MSWSCPVCNGGRDGDHGACIVGAELLQLVRQVIAKLDIIIVNQGIHNDKIDRARQELASLGFNIQAHR